RVFQRRHLKVDRWVVLELVVGTPPGGRAIFSPFAKWGYSIVPGIEASPPAHEVRLPLRERASDRLDPFRGTAWDAFDTQELGNGLELRTSRKKMSGELKREGPSIGNVRLDVPKCGFELGLEQ